MKMTLQFINLTRQIAALFLAILVFVTISEVVSATVEGTVSVENKRNAVLYPIKQNNRFGYINRSGKVVIRPRFEEVTAFSENLAAVKRKGKWGFIDTHGRTVVTLQFEAVEPFRHGLAIVKGTGKWGFVDNKGRITIPPRFDWAMSLREGMALVARGGRYGFVGSDGQISIALRFAEAGEFWEGLARVQVGGLWGFIDQTGKMVIEPRFSYAGNFHEGLAQVKINDKHGYIDRTGQMVIPPIFDGHRLEWFSEGLAMIAVGNKYGYIDKGGKIVIPPRYWLAWHFQEGAASVQLDDAKWVLINRVGETMGEGRFDNIADFQGGLARVRNFRDYGFIDPKGKIVVPVAFSAALPFSEGLAAVYLGGSHEQLIIGEPHRRFDPMSPHFLYLKLPFTGEETPRMSGGKGWGYIDKHGAMVIAPGFDFAGSFTGELAEVRQGDRHGYIDRLGKFIWEIREAAPDTP
jgi:hypothetical protein